uniref:ATP synthase subunit 8 n=1 Tax=Astralium haematragum TaxID=307057 RepID=A0A1I9SSS4_9VEST|nr:ATP synthase F0 subunit 8 [Astralium haematragum]AOZ71794.1 ATP synthase subunit 8 [Astralium haematragum]
MPQLAPLNWLFLFFLFWLMVVVSSILIWWSFKMSYTIDRTDTKFVVVSPKSWDW